MSDVFGMRGIQRVGYLRAKTESGDEPRLIQTVRGVGYVLREPS